MGGRAASRWEAAAGGSGLACVPDTAAFVLCSAALPRVMQGVPDTDTSGETTAFITAVAKQCLLAGQEKTGLESGSYQSEIPSFASLTG